jgi:hypothetical protein
MSQVTDSEVPVLDFLDTLEILAQGGVRGASGIILVEVPTGTLIESLSSAIRPIESCSTTSGRDWLFLFPKAQIRTCSA